MSEIIEKKAPKFLKLICLVSGTYHGLLLLIFIFLLFSNSYVTESFNTYTAIELKSIHFFLFEILGIVLSLSALMGVILICRQLRSGLIIYILSNSIFITAQVLIPEPNWINIFINLLFISLFSIFIRFLK